MKADWKEFLISFGAEFSDQEDRVTTYGNPLREPRMALNSNVMCDLSHKGLISVQGDDRQTFLQSQTSNNFQNISETRSSLGSYCSPKGRILTSFRVFERSGNFYLTLKKNNVHAILKRLRMFVLMSKVVLEDANDALVRFGFSGPDAETELTKHAGGFPAELNDVYQSGDLTIIRVFGIHPRFEVYGTFDACTKLWDRLNVNCAPVGADAWDTLNIRAGIPEIGEDTWEMFVPQMVNLQRVEAISFKKGCYPGQEVVARMHYLGKVKRRMFRVCFETNDVPTPGTPLFSSEDGAPQAAGNIVNAIENPDGGVEALAVLILRFVENESPIHLGTEDGPLASAIEIPPYGFEEEEA